MNNQHHHYQLVLTDKALISLSKRRRECLRLLAAGYTVDGIAIIMDIKVTSVRSLIRYLMHVHGSVNQTQIIVRAVTHGFLTIE